MLTDQFHRSLCQKIFCVSMETVHHLYYTLPSYQILVLFIVFELSCISVYVWVA